MNKYLSFILFTLLSVLLLRSIHADEGIRASLSSPQQTLTVGDVVNLLLEVRHPAGEHVIFPQLGQSWGDFEVREQSPPAFITHEDGSQSSQQTIAVTLWAPGSFTTPLLTVTVSTPSGELSEVIVEPLTLNVVSVLQEGETELRELKPQATLAPPFPLAPSSLLPWFVGGLLLATFSSFALWSIYRRWRGHPSLLDTRPADEVAFSELKRIKAANLPAQGDFKGHYTLVTDILRRYLEQRYTISVMDQTTSQLKEALEAISISPPHQSELMSILGEADFVKFADVKPDLEAAKLFPERVRELILAIRPLAVEPLTNGKQTSAVEVMK